VGHQFHAYHEPNVALTAEQRLVVGANYGAGLYPSEKPPYTFSIKSFGTNKQAAVVPFSVRLPAAVVDWTAGS
jgi:hypothetical protein